jgi:hypothetical protein
MQSRVAILYVIAGSYTRLYDDPHRNFVTWMVSVIAVVKLEDEQFASELNHMSIGCLLYM